MSVHVIILAAGEGTRMKAGRPKVLQEVAGKPMVNWAVDAALGAEPASTTVVIGFEADAVSAVLPDGVATVLQAEQNGTAHATRLATEAIAPAGDDVVVVLPGDAPLIRSETLAALVAQHGDNAATMVTTTADDPTGYGRVLREGGAVTAIVEHADASPDQLEVTEVATSIYAFTAAPLVSALTQVSDGNVQGEEYLPDVIGIFVADGLPVAALEAAADEVAGVNSYDQLATAAETMRSRINTAWMREGVLMTDPARTYIDATVTVSAGARILPGTHLEGATTVGAGASVGPDCHVSDSSVGPDAVVRYSVLEAAEIGASASVGPFAFLRHGTVMGVATKAGAHTELKNTTLADGAKVPHLSYIGDATLGEDANVGAGSITCNWDGFDKHETIIGAGARVGSDTMLVAPVEIGEGAYTGAGSVISKDVPPGSLAVERSPQREIPGYAERRSKRAEADE